MVPSDNNWVFLKQNLSSTEWYKMLKMNAMAPPIRTIPGCSFSNRHCSKYETLSHVLGNCPQGQLLQIKQHDIVKSLLANDLHSEGQEVHVEVNCITDGTSKRRIDIISINRKKGIVEIIDLIRPQEDHAEKKSIYEPIIPYFCQKYNGNNITVTGLFSVLGEL